jgi:ribose transport system ATP-binding protein
MISSELPEVLRMSHRVVVMAEGRVSGVLSHEDVTQEAVMHLATLRPNQNLADAAELGLPERADRQTGPTTDPNDQKVGER